MGKRGPAPAPTAVKRLRGQRIHNPNEPVPQPGLECPQPPEGLSLLARGVWERLAPDLWRTGVLTEWDRDAFGVYCSAVANHREAQALVDERGVVVTSERGGVKNPAMQVVRDCATTILQYGARFGLTPSDRQALRMDDTEPEDDARRLLAG